MRKVADFLKMVAFLACIALGSAWLASNAEVNLGGAAKVLDGDSLVVAGEEIRLLGIDAPEYRQTCEGDAESQPFACGKQAAAFLRGLVKGKRVECDGWEKDKYNRLLAVCSVGDMVLNEELVANGWAVSFGDYYREENEARNAKNGIWAGPFEAPSQWRRSERDAHSTGWMAKFKFW